MGKEGLSVAKLGEGSADLVAGRTELKYVIARSRVEQLVVQLDRELRRHHHEGERSALAPMAEHFTTTVYFDTASGDLYRVALSGDDHVKLRAREYYDVLPLAELATDAAELLRHKPVLWLELKLRAGDVSGKRRVGIPKRRLMGFLSSGVVDDELRAIQRKAYGPEGEAVLNELVEFMQGVSQPLRPSCVANYRRNAWQDGAGQLRVTLDQELAFYAPTRELWEREAVLTRHLLGVPARRETRDVIEVKHHGALPPWLPTALQQVGAERVTYSKFAQASQAVADLVLAYK